MARLIRAAAAAELVAGRGRHARAARTLARCALGLRRRGADPESAAASCALATLRWRRGDPAGASKAIDGAADWSDGPLRLRALVLTAWIRHDAGCLREAEAIARTAETAATAAGAPCPEARRVLASALLLRRCLDSAESALGDPTALDAGGLAVLAEVKRHGGDLVAAMRCGAQAMRDADPSVAAEARLASARAAVGAGNMEEAVRHLAAAVAAARQARTPALHLRALAEQCAVTGETRSRARLLRAATRLPPLAAARVRASLDPGDPQLHAFVAGSGATLLLPAAPPAGTAARFQDLLDAVQDAPDDAAALVAVAGRTLAALAACSLVIRSAARGQIVAAVGRPWPGEAPLTRATIDGGAAIFRAELMAEAGEPVRSSGTTIGAIAARWVPGAAPAPARVREWLQLAAAAVAPCLRAAAAPPATFEATYPDHLLGDGPAAERIREAIRRAASAPYPVLIEGESGSGKELVARGIHARSLRKARRFCAVNCAALTEDLLEAELFGHARGAFTGAAVERTGLFEEADQGTLFLDEVVELSPRAQAKLLRVLQEGEVRRVGENHPRRVDVRVVAATNRPLDQEVRGGRFRADLRFRLDVLRIVLPPLRERPDEIPALASRIWAETAERVGTRAELSAEVIATLARYDWPGNVRELQNVLAALAVHAPRRGRVSAALLPGHLGSAVLHVAAAFEDARVEFERRFVRAAMARAGGRRAAAAAQLGVSRQGLAKMLKRLGIGDTPEPSA